MSNSQFKRRGFGGSGCYTCRICKKRTRETGGSESMNEMCRNCDACSMQENSHSDNHHPGHIEDCSECLGSMKQQKVNFAAYLATT